jgi:hypothetical protein
VRLPGRGATLSSDSAPGELKPLTCRAFPFHVLDVEGETIVTASFSCPTVARNEGARLSQQSVALERLIGEWRRRRPRRYLPRLLEPGRPLEKATLDLLREILLEMLDRRGPDGALDLRANVDRIARTLADLGRRQVARLAPDRFAEYLELTGRFAARSDKPLPPRPRAGRLTRGFILAVWTAALERRQAVSFLARRFRAARLALHVHGLGPAVGDFDLRRVRRLRWPELDDPLWQRIHHFLRSGIQTLGTGRWPVVAEMGVHVATLNAALALAACASADGTLDETALLAGLNQAADIQHAEARSAVRMLGLLGGGVESLHVFASGRLI